MLENGNTQKSPNTIIGIVEEGVSYNGRREKAPNSIPVLVMGALSLCFASASCLYSLMAMTVAKGPVLSVMALLFVVVAIVLGVIGRLKVNKGYEMYNASPDSYYGEGMLKAGRTLTVVGIVVAIVGAVMSLGGFFL